jgi:hypothetical protein
MSHGIAALEYAPFPSGAIWDWAAAFTIPVVFANTGLKQKIVNPEAFFEDAFGVDEVFSRAFVRIAGHVRPFRTSGGEYAEEYGRFQPRDRSDFIYACDRCRECWPSLVVPGTVSDDAALRTLQNFVDLDEEMGLKQWIFNQPIASIAKAGEIETPWGYFICLIAKREFTLFVSDDSTVVNDFEARVRALSNEYRIRERW